jgi:hypothetical protein
VTSDVQYDKFTDTHSNECCPAPCFLSALLEIVEVLRSNEVRHASRTSDVGATPPQGLTSMKWGTKLPLLLRAMGI